MIRALPLAILLLQTPTPPAPAAPPFDPKTALQQALDRIKAASADDDHKRYTFLERERVMGFDKLGAKYFDVARTYDVTWINDKPYLRLIKFDDKPLSPKDEKKDQKLYHDAIAKRGDLGMHKRDQLAGFHESKSGMADPFSALGPDYSITEIAAGPSGDSTLHVLEARQNPSPRSKSECPWRFRFWISDKDPFLSRYVVDVPDNKTPLCHDAQAEAAFTLVDGIPKAARWTVRFHTSPDLDTTAIDDYIYSNYRRFTTSVTLRPGNGEPPPPEAPAKPTP